MDDAPPPMKGRNAPNSSSGASGASGASTPIPSKPNVFPKSPPRAARRPLQMEETRSIPLPFFPSSLLPVACCLLPVACCLLPVACCLLPVACCLLPYFLRIRHQIMIRI
ncbi:MAG: hypothetical protein F6K31_10085 [Symploca sp. SIO2G7]|nr:hypothetical protein [Symploca sp. SIO2G7]